MRSYRVKTIFGPTLQGEGLHAGMPCLFVRLAGCNAWDGRPETRAQSACPYCDTDFAGGEALGLQSIRDRLDALAVAAYGQPGGIPRHLGLVLTGGEPLLQADADLITGLATAFAWVDIETNGTRPCPERPANVFISCSPKRIPGQAITIAPDWWKVLIPDQQDFLPLALGSGKPVFVQPTCPDQGPSGEVYQQHVAACLDLCFRHGCRMSVQIHKHLGIP